MTEYSGMTVSQEETTSSPEPPPLPTCPPPELIDLVSNHSDDSICSKEDESRESSSPPVAPPRIHRHKSRGQEAHVTFHQEKQRTESRTESKTEFNSGLTEDQQHKLSNSHLINKSDNHVRAHSTHLVNHEQVKLCPRQRHPALLLQPLKSETFSNLTRVSHINRTMCPVVQLIPLSKVPSQQSSQQRMPPPSSFWTSDHLPSGSEFDTTRLGAYINNFHNQRNNSFVGQHQPRSGRQVRRNPRSKSVDRSHVRNNSSNCQLPTMIITKDIKYPLVNNKNEHVIDLRKHHHIMSGQQHHNNQEQQKSHNLSRLVSSLKATAINAANRALIIPRTDSLNSSDPDSGSTSGDNENDVSSSPPTTKSLVSRSMEPAKSALKKSVSSSSNSTLASPSPKNVTFSAFATIQMMVDE